MSADQSKSCPECGSPLAWCTCTNVPAFMAEETVRLPDPAGQPMKDLVAEIESCGYRCEAGPLSLNVAWMEIKRRAERAWEDEQAIAKALDLLGDCTGVMELVRKIIKTRDNAA